MLPLLISKNCFKQLNPLAINGNLSQQIRVIKGKRNFSYPSLMNQTRIKQYVQNSD